MVVGIATSSLAFIAYGGLLILVYQRGLKSSQSGFFFFVYLLDMLLLQAAYFGASVAHNEQWALIWYTLNIPLSSAQIAIYFLFVRKFLGIQQPRILTPAVIFIWILTIGAIMAYRSSIFIDIYRDPVTGLFVPEIGSAAGILAIPTLIFLSATVIDLVHNYRGKSRPQQARIQYLFLAIIIVWTGMAANAVPALRPYPVDVLANILSAFMIAYAILRYQLIEINTALRKGLEFFVSLAVVGAGSMFVIFLFTKFAHVGMETDNLLLAVTIATITLMALLPLRDRIQQSIGRTLFKTTYDGYLMIQRLSRTATSILDLKKLSETILMDIVNTLRIRWGVLLLKQDDGDFQPIAWKGIADNHILSIDQNHPILNWISKHETTEVGRSLSEALEQKALSKRQLSDLNLTGSELFIPLRIKDNLIGILCLGPKLTNKPYSQEDEQILVTVTNNIASAIDNARLYEALQAELQERKRMEKGLRENQELFALFMRHSPVYTYIKEVTPTESRVLQASDNFKEMIGVTSVDMTGKTMAGLFPPEFAAKITADDWDVIAKGKVLKLDEDLNDRHYTTIKFPLVQGDKTLLAGYTIDITERKQAEQKLKEANKHLEEQLGQIKILRDHLREQATRDHLTGLYNRRYLHDTMERELSHAKRENYPVSAMMIDIDHFKDFNDTYGHQAGDEVLIALGNLLRDSIRQGDIACRYGGEEFIVLMLGLDQKDAGQRAEMLRSKFNRSRINYDGTELSASISVGVAFYPQHGNDMNEIIKAADEALYEAKQAGRNRVYIWRSDGKTN